MADVIFGSGIIEQHVFNTLRTRSTIQAAIGNPVRLKAVSAVPPGMDFPLAIHYFEVGEYAVPINTNAGPDAERLRYVVRFICQGESTSPIRAAAKDAFTALSIEFDQAAVTQDGDTYNLTLTPINEYPLTTIVEERNGVALFYRQLGFVLDAFVSAA